MQQTVCTCSPKISIAEAAKAMLAAHSGYLVVVENGALVGILTESDFIQRTEGYRMARGLRIPHIFHQLIEKGTPLEQQYVAFSAAPVSSIMSANVVTIHADATLEALDALMDSRHLRRIPVLEHGRVVGIVTARELMALTFAQ